MTDNGIQKALTSLPITQYLDTFYYRIIRSGYQFTFQWSRDGITYTTAFTETMGSQIDSLPQGVGITGQAFWSDTSTYSQYDYIYVAPPPEHELAVSLEAPSFLGLCNSTVLNATVQNQGLNNETSVEFYLLINGTVVSSATIPELLVGESRTISYLWTPTGTGNYNVRAYVPPIMGEEYVTNNIVTKETRVFFYRRLYLPHEWIGLGEPLGWYADDWSWQYTLPFDFPFYGINYRTIYISSNGLITFTGPDTSYGDSITALADKFAIAPAWDDWVSDDIYIWENPNCVGIRWYVHACGSSTIANFEAILDIDGAIQFNYEYNDGPISATIGISRGAGHILAEDATSLNYINTMVFLPYPGEHDVAVTDAISDRTWVYQGYNAHINVTVLNKGDFAENVTVTLYYNITANKIIGTQYNITLFPGQNQTLFFVLDTTGVEYCHNYTITAVATIPLDNNPADNTKDNVYIKVRIIGDLNGDGKVDITDLAMASAAFGSYPGHPRWNPAADINRDNRIDIQDIARVSANFGKTSP
jgi:hypothetical protein